MRKKFHIVKLHLEGRIDHPIRNVSPDMDVADEFHRLSYLLGFEAGIDEYSGLWSTKYVYDDFSSLAGDFLRRGLTLDLSCDSSLYIPFTPILACLQQTIAPFGICEINRVDVECNLNALRMNIKKAQTNADTQKYIDCLHDTATPRIEGISTLLYSAIGFQGQILFSSKYKLLQQPSSLSDLGLPLSAMWSEYERKIVKSAKIISLTAC
ncbi:hypothetical protein [Mobiluncus mulieris]|uniref:hypothetical protein n=1 Tax=Mobiluncus mulieris TaxID=2052 RepID=UPI0009D67A68|nr:hypothetical protein [Mobiluncus mulieris]